MGAFEELLASWRANPAADSTLALCSYLGTSDRTELMREVAHSAETWHRHDAQVMLSVGRMYLDGGLLSEAQATLVHAGKIQPRDPKPYRYLGEVLLRRGDAARAEKVLARCLELGAAEPEARLWHDRSTVYVALQKRIGMKAVADEIARTCPKVHSIPPPSAPLRSVPPPLPSRPSGSSRPPRSSARVAPARGRSAVPALSRATGPAPSPVRRELPTEIDPVQRAVGRGGALAYASPTSQAAAAIPARSELGALPVVFEASSAPPPLPTTASFRPLTLGAAVAPVDEAAPDAATVLSHLQAVGIYEPDGGAEAAWEAAPRRRQRGAWTLALASVFTVAAGVGAFRYSERLKAERAAQARQLEGEIRGMLDSASVERLTASDAQFTQVFELDSRSHEAAVMWLQNRALNAVLLSDTAEGIGSALQRAETVGVAPERVGFGKVASFLAEGDVAGAVALLPKLDPQLKEDTFYQFVAGVALERAGDARAQERYQRAVTLDRAFLPAVMMRAQAVAFEGEGDARFKALEEAAAHFEGRPTAKALRGLSWALNPQRSERPPENARLSDEERAKLPVPLRVAPLAADAVSAMSAGQRDRALESVRAGVGQSTTPATAAWLGFLAIDLGDEALARQAALRALGFSGMYPQARALAARVALLGARLDEAKKAVSELDTGAQEVLTVNAAVGYETLDLSGLESASEALEAIEADWAAALVAAPDVALGRSRLSVDELKAMSIGAVPWGELVALDAALDRGDEPLAATLVEAWDEGAKRRPAYALRQARLLRYQKKFEEAVGASGVALEGEITPRVLIERFNCLLAGGYSQGARELVTKYPTVLGQMTEWLKVSLDAAVGKTKRAESKLARLEVPAGDQPLLLRVMVARALASVADERGKAYVAVLLASHPKHVDVLEAAQAYGG